MVGPGNPGCVRSWIPPAARFHLGKIPVEFAGPGMGVHGPAWMGSSFLVSSSVEPWMLYQKVVSTEWEQIK